MKRKKLALMLAMSLTFTSFSGAGWPVYADELPEIVEDEAEDADAAEYVAPEEEQPIALEEETDAASGDEESDTAEQQQSNEEKTETAALYGDFVESVEVVDEAEAPEVYSEDGDENGAGMKIQDYTEEVYVYPDEDVTLSVTATCTHGTLSYQWYEDGYEKEEVISEEAFCRVPTKTAFYVCKVSNGYEEYEVECSVWVDSGFVINEEQKTITVHVNERAALSVNVVTDYSDTLTYQWEQWDEKEDEWRKISGADSSEYRTGEMETENLYRCLVSDGYNQGLAYRTVKVDRGFVVKKGEEYVYADANATAVLSVDASTREGTLTYQWYDIQDEKIEGATSAQLILKNVTEDYSSYYCIVSNGYEEEKVYRTVRTAERVNEEDVITVGGGGTRYILPGENVKLYVTVPIDKKYVSYKWYKGSWADEEVELIGVERSVTVDQGGEYYCDVTHGTFHDSIPFEVKFDDGFGLISKDKEVKVPYGESTILKAEASILYGELSYQWYKNGKELEGKTEATLEISATTQRGSYDEYICVITNNIDGWGDSKEVTYRVGVEYADALSIEAPERVAVGYGEDMTLSVNIKGAGSDKLTYLWYVYVHEDGSYSEEYKFLSKKEKLKIYNVTQVKRYKCVVSDGIEKKSIELLVGPKEKLDLCAENLAHAKVLTENAPCSAGTYNAENVYMLFTPDKSGLWNIYSEMGQNYGGRIYDSMGREVSNYENYEFGDHTSLITELQAGKTYTVYFWNGANGSEVELTAYAKYLGNSDDAHEHTWNSGTITKHPTCVETGVKTYTCLECHATYTEEIPATGAHTMTTVVDRAATCGAAGSQHCECTVCHTKEASTSIPATGAHTMTTVVDRAAMCGTAGSQHRECTVCHTRETSTSIPATGAHKFGAYTVTQQPTVLATGIQVRTCSVCGKTESASIPKLSGTMTLKANSLPLQLKKTIELINVVTGLMAGDSIVSCSSNNTKVATVSPTGKVTAKKAGKATIAITLASGVSRSVTVKVQKGAVKTSKISGVASKVTLEAGKSLALSPVVTPLTTKDKLSYSSSNKKVAKVSKSGVITAKASGKAKITIKSGRKKFVVTVTVPKKAPTDMQGVPATKSLKKGKSFTIKTKLLPTGAEAKVTYKSSNKKVATVNAKGKVTAKKAGTAVITVTAGGIKQTCIVTVK